MEIFENFSYFAHSVRIDGYFIRLNSYGKGKKEAVFHLAELGTGFQTSRPVLKAASFIGQTDFGTAFQRLHRQLGVSIIPSQEAYGGLTALDSLVK